MNKYKVGDKFIIEVEEVFEDKNHFPYRMKRKDSTWLAQESFLDEFPQLVQGVDTACYNKGAEDAWETANRVLFGKDISNKDLDEIFGTLNHFAIMRDNTPQEAKAKIEAWEKKKEESIRVGDVVENNNTKSKGVVTNVYKDTIGILYETGSVGTHNKNNFRKIGRRVDIKPVLEQLMGN